MSKAVYGAIAGTARKIKNLYNARELGFKALDYIEVTGAQWIDTGFTPDNNSRMVIDFALTDTSVEMNDIIGSRSTTSSKAFTFSAVSGKWRVGYNKSSTTTVAIDSSRHIADLNKNVLHLDGTVIYTAAVAEFTGFASIYIGAIHANNTGYTGHAKIYACQIYDNDMLIRNYVPCINHEEEIGMYDTVNGVFYPNAGADEFVAGNEIPSYHITSKIKKGYGVQNGITIPFYSALSTVLDENDWSTIQEVAAADQGANYWSVGDRKGVTLNGRVGAYTFSNATYYCYILGFDHNESIEGKGIHFQFGFTALSDGKNIAFCDSLYSAAAGSSAAFRINTTASMTGSWAASYMNKTICPAFFYALPKELQNAISVCMKYTNNGGMVSGTDPSYVTSSQSYIWLLSEFEIYGAISMSHSSEKNYQQRYSYYANGNSRVKYMNNDISSSCWWWTRSATVAQQGWCVVSSSGVIHTMHTNTSRGFAPCFKVA